MKAIKFLPKIGVCESWDNTSFHILVHKMWPKLEDFIRVVNHIRIANSSMED